MSPEIFIASGYTEAVNLQSESPIPVAVSWSGGKDSALALERVLRDERYQVVALLCAIDMYRDRVLIHEVYRALVEEQAQALELPLQLALLPGQPLGGQPDERIFAPALQNALDNLQAGHGVQAIIFGDIFAEASRKLHQAQAKTAGLDALFPLWRESTRHLSTEFCENDYKGVVVCVDHERLDDRFCGRCLDHHFFRELPGGVDPCGENGEYHSFVTSVPSFRQEINVTPQPAVRHGRFVYCDLH